MRNTSGLKRTAGPGRPVGSKTKRTKAMQEWAREFFESDEWRESAKNRMLKGKAPHLEAHIMACELPKPLPSPPKDLPGRLFIGWMSEPE